MQLIQNNKNARLKLINIGLKIFALALVTSFIIPFTKPGKLRITSTKW